MIEVNALNVALGHKPILKNINLRWERPGLIALIGLNGAGKSTLLGALSGLKKPESGTVKIDGVDLKALSPRALSLKLALLPQTPPVLGRMRVVDLLEFGRFPYHQGRPDQEDRKIIESTLLRFSLVDLRDRMMDTLSGGQRQRVYIAMAFVQTTPHLLLDEPLNNLDMYHAYALMTLIHQYTQAAKVMTVMVVHDINVAARWADHVVGLKAGECRFEGHPKEVITKSNLATLFDLDVDVIEHKGHPLVVPF